MLPSLKEKKRYIVFEIKGEHKIDFNDVKKEIDTKMLKFLGELGYGKAGLMIVEGNGNKGIIKVNNKHVDEARTALALVKDLNDEKVVIQTLGVSGILKKAKERWN